MRRNRLILLALIVVLVAAIAAIVLQLAAPETRGRLYGWTGDTTPSGQPATPSR